MISAWFAISLDAVFPVSMGYASTNGLEVVAQSMKGAEVIQIGEASHGTAEFYTLKTKLVRYLHENCGINVLAIESGMLETTLAMDRREEFSAQKLMEDSVFGNFRWKESLPLFEYIKSRPKLKVIGIDPQFSSDSVLTLVADVVRPADQELAKEIEKRLGEGYSMYGLREKPSEFKAAQKSYVQWLDSAVRRIKNLKLPKSNASKLPLVLRGFAGLKTYWGTDLKNFGSAEHFALRDQLMFENMRALSKGERVMLWAHNGHIGRRIGYKTMGEWIHESYGSKTYALGLFAKPGEYYVHWERKAAPFSPDPKGLESMVPSDGNAWFIDYRSNPKLGIEETTAFEPENGGLITFVPRHRFSGVIVVPQSRVPTRVK